MSRESVIEKSAPMIGRNEYNQSLRQYAIKPYADGKYYSDCSSFCSAAFMAAGYEVNWNNTYSFCTDDDFYTVPIVQVGNAIQNAASVLKVADVIIWPGHCNMVHHIDGNTVYVQDHGADQPQIRTLENVQSWNSGEIVVRRLKAFDDEDNSSDIVENNSVTEVKPELESGLYKVQAGSFASENAAKQLGMKLVSRGFASTVLKKDSNYIVQCGAFKNQENASNLATLLREAGFEAYVWQ